MANNNIVKDKMNELLIQADYEIPQFSIIRRRIFYLLAIWIGARITDTISAFLLGAPTMMLSVAAIATLIFAFIISISIYNGVMIIALLPLLGAAMSFAKLPSIISLLGQGNALLDIGIMITIFCNAIQLGVMLYILLNGQVRTYANKMHDIQQNMKGLISNIQEKQ